ncbi:hypothetical protein QOL99_10060 [Deinococcus sp. MIMF12]|uniref:Uncharacterized protein n=1 Tax=Deinococcus rhizophilus TaxID=3049544 RepID=A0ABT7JKL2_9DEIO|nr:hypothetical protein [Deinococcus rhizophilus]MDL2344498.1 hypothetical protein [Deinococcus rhizophilus]
MNHKGAVLAALALAGLALAAPHRYEMRSFVNVEGKVGGVQPAFAWCDAPGRVLVLRQFDTPAGPARRNAPQYTVTELYEWPKTRAGLGKLRRSEVRIGWPDAGAGQTFHSLKATSGPRQGQSGHLRTSTVENEDPAYRMTRVNEFRLNGTSYRCRYQPQAVFMGSTAQRTVIVWDNGRAATYATRNFDGTPGMYVTGGKVSYDELGPEYIFSGAGGYSYRVKYHDSSAFVQVRRNGKMLQSEHFLAYSVSMPTPSTPIPTVPIKYPSTP